MKTNSLSVLRKIAYEVAQLSLEISYKAKTGHVGSALSIVDLLTVLYVSKLRIDKSLLKDNTRDRFILSKGHAAAALYAVLYKKGILSKKALYSFGQDRGLCEHPLISDPGVEMSTGSLGQGLGFGVGIALGQKKFHFPSKTYILLSDGELGEGSVWETALLASRLHLDNVVAIIDYNKWQCFGKSTDISNLEPLSKKWKSFGWETITINGHDITAIKNTFNKLPIIKNKPTVIIANTISGKGVQLIEDKLIGHYKIFTNNEYIQAAKDLKEKYSL